jgi:hypothetical protein
MAARLASLHDRKRAAIREIAQIDRDLLKFEIAAFFYAPFVG